MQAFHIPADAPLYTNTFLLISDAGHAVVIDPAADAPKPCAPSGTQSSTVRLRTLQATACIRFLRQTAAMPRTAP